MKSIKKTARLAGLMYLLLIIFGMGGQVIRRGFIVSGDAAATAQKILANSVLFNAGNVMWLVSLIAFLLLALALYPVLKPVSQLGAASIVLFAVVGTAIEGINTLNVFAAQQLLSGAGAFGGVDYFALFDAGQVYAQVMHTLNLSEAGYHISMVLSFGPWLIPTGYLMYKSGCYPRWFGLLVLLTGAVHLLGEFQYYLLPSFDISGVISAVTVLGEFTLAGWLLVKGVDAEAWEKRALESA